MEGRGERGGSTEGMVGGEGRRERRDDSAAFEHAHGERKKNKGNKQGKYLFHFHPSVWNNEPVPSIGGDVSSTEKCNKTYK